jgi:hypothetical protein
MALTVNPVAFAGYTTQSGTFAELIDGDTGTGWAPYATSLSSLAPTPPNRPGDTGYIPPWNGNWRDGSNNVWVPWPGQYIPDYNLIAYIGWYNYKWERKWSWIEFDFEEPVCLTHFQFIADDPGALGDMVLIGANFSGTQFGGESLIGGWVHGVFDKPYGTTPANYSQPIAFANVTDGAVHETDLALTGDKFRYYRFMQCWGLGATPNGTTVREFLPTILSNEVGAGGWDPDDKTANLTLSDENRVATWVSSGNGGVRGARHRSSGKHYFEITDIVLTNSDDGVGLATEDWVLGSFSGFDQFYTWAYGSGGFTNPTGHVVGVCADLDSDPINFRCWLNFDNGPWHNESGVLTGPGGVTVVDPSDYTTGKGFPRASIDWLAPSARLRVSGDTAKLLTAATELNYAPPAGFVAWEDDMSYLWIAAFTDFDPLENVVVMTLTDPSSYDANVIFVDESEFTATMQLTYNYSLAAAFVDETVFDNYLAINVSHVVQVTLNIIGR